MKRAKLFSEKKYFKMSPADILPRMKSIIYNTMYRIYPKFRHFNLCLIDSSTPLSLDRFVSSFRGGGGLIYYTPRKPCIV